MISQSEMSADILLNYDEDEIKKILSEQLNEGGNSITIINHFEPMLTLYNNIITSNDTFDGDEDLVNDARNAILSIAIIFIETICDKYSIYINEEAYSSNIDNAIKIASNLYSFFVIEQDSILQTVFMNYITRNFDNLVSAYTPSKVKKDASTLSNKKLLGSDYGVLMANIYDITSWIVDNLIFNAMLDYASIDIECVEFVTQLINSGDVECDEVGDVLSEVYKNNNNLKSRVCFECIATLKRQFDNLSNPIE